MKLNESRDLTTNNNPLIRMVKKNRLQKPFRAMYKIHKYKKLRTPIYSVMCVCVCLLTNLSEPCSVTIFISDFSLLTHAIRHWIRVQRATRLSYFNPFQITMSKHILQLALETLISVNKK